MDKWSKQNSFTTSYNRLLTGLCAVDLFGWLITFSFSCCSIITITSPAHKSSFTPAEQYELCVSHVIQFVSLWVQIYSVNSLSAAAGGWLASIMIVDFADGWLRAAAKHTPLWRGAASLSLIAVSMSLHVNA